MVLSKWNLMYVMNANCSCIKMCISFIENGSSGAEKIPHSNEEISWDDATWILTSSFIIFTMQTGECIKYVVCSMDMCVYTVVHIA